MILPLGAGASTPRAPQRPGQHDDLGEGRIRQFRRHREEEAGRALTDIVVTILASGWSSSQCSSFSTVAVVVPMLVPSGSRTSIRTSGLSDVGKNCSLSHPCQRRRTPGDADDTACDELVAHGKGDEPSQAPIVRRVVDRAVPPSTGLIAGHLDAEIGCEDHRHDPGDDEGEPHDPEDVAGAIPRSVYCSGRPNGYGVPRTCWHRMGWLFLNVGAKPTDPWIALDVAQAARTSSTAAEHHSLGQVDCNRESAGGHARRVFNQDLAVGHYKPINSRRFLHDCHEFVFHFTPAWQHPARASRRGRPL